MCQIQGKSFCVNLMQTVCTQPRISENVFSILQLSYLKTDILRITKKGSTELLDCTLIVALFQIDNI